MRARNIKPSLFKNEVLGVADPLLTILFQGLWAIADREGRLEDRPLRIKAEIFPYRDADIDRYLTELEREGFILRYEVEGVRYILVVNFTKHQHVHRTEKASTYPSPPKSNGSLTVKPPLDNRDKPSDRLKSERLKSDIAASEPKAPPQPMCSTTLPLNDGSEFSITLSTISEWKTLYPATDPDQELRKMRGWLIGNPTKKKTKTGVMRFCTAWLSKAQDRGGVSLPAPKIEKPKLAIEEVRRQLAEG